jgi:hypothetical protein
MKFLLFSKELQILVKILVNNLNTTDNNMGLTESFSASTELCNAHGNLKFFGFEIAFDFYLFIFVCTWSKLCLINSKIMYTYCVWSDKWSFKLKWPLRFQNTIFSKLGLQTFCIKVTWNICSKCWFLCTTSVNAMAKVEMKWMFLVVPQILLLRFKNYYPKT